MRPIGLLPDVSSVWMAIRKRQQKAWSLEKLDRKHGAAAPLAARTPAGMEVAKFQGKHALLAFLDCSKRFERVGHKLAGDRAVATGLQSRIANMVFDMCTGGINTFKPMARWRFREQETMGELQDASIRGRSGDGSRVDPASVRGPIRGRSRTGPGSMGGGRAGVDWGECSGTAPASGRG